MRHCSNEIILFSSISINTLDTVDFFTHKREQTSKIFNFVSLLINTERNEIQELMKKLLRSFALTISTNISLIEVNRIIYHINKHQYIINKDIN
jgi:hypothetical protein